VRKAARSPWTDGHQQAQAPAKIVVRLRQNGFASCHVRGDQAEEVSKRLRDLIDFAGSNGPHWMAIAIGLYAMSAGVAIFSARAEENGASFCNFPL